MTKTVTLQLKLHAPGGHWNDVKGKIGSESWLKLLWLSMILDGGPTAQISRNLEKIMSSLNFFGHKTDFPAPKRSATLRALTFERSSGGKIDIFEFFMINYACSGMAERFHQVLGG